MLIVLWVPVKGMRANCMCVCMCMYVFLCFYALFSISFKSHLFPPSVLCKTFLSTLSVCVCVCVCMRACMLSHVQLFAILYTVTWLGSSVHGIFEARILDWVAISSRGSSRPRNWTHMSCVSCIGRWILYHWATWEGFSLLSLLMITMIIYFVAQGSYY